MKWFKHDADASSDAKIKKLILRHGAEGYAIYFHCIELITGDVTENKITFELEHDAEIIADNLKIKGDASFSGVEKVNQIMRYIVELGLFDENNGHISCYKIAKRLDLSMTSNPRFRELIASVKSHDSVMTESCKTRLDYTILEKKEGEAVGKPPARPRFVKPTLGEVKAYCQERKNQIAPQGFIDYYDSKGWLIGKTGMKDWKAAVRTWEQRDSTAVSAQKASPSVPNAKMILSPPPCTCGATMDFNPTLPVALCDCGAEWELVMGAWSQTRAGGAGRAEIKIKIGNR
jgi:hypothetical protein